jgi:hypothetical protein
MIENTSNKMISRVVECFQKEFGAPARDIDKVKAWDIRRDFGVVVEVDSPKREQAAYIWLPYPPDNQPVPEIALEYAGGKGRHSNTYPSPGLRKGLPALKLIVRTESELGDTVKYIRARRDSLPPSEIKQSPLERDAQPVPVDVSSMPPVEEAPLRREAIPRSVQREVWQRDGGRCVECGTREKLCFDHIVPFSRGGSNTARNLQLMCERCNLSKGNRL